LPALASRHTLSAMRKKTDAPQRLLTTVMFTDIVGSTSMAAELGDRRWRQLVAKHHEIVRRALKKYRGRELDTAGDGFFASFDQPGWAIACAVELTRSLRSLGIEIRVGVNMGEVEVMGSKVGGIAVHVGSRVMSIAGPGEIWVSSTVRDLMGGSDVRFEDRGVHELKGVPAQWHLYSVEVAPTPEPLPEEAAEEPITLGSRSRLLRRRSLLVGGVATLVAVAVVVGLLIGGGDGGHPRPSGSPSPAGFAAADRVDRILQSGSSANLARIVPVRVGHDPSAVAVGEGTIWVANESDGTVSRIDPVTNSATVIKVGRGPHAIAVGEGGIWVLNRTGHSVSRIDPASNEVVTEIPVDAPGFPNTIAVGEGSVWVGVEGDYPLGDHDPSVHKIDPWSNKDVASIPIRNALLWVVLTTGDGAVWAAGNNGALSRIDPRTNKQRGVTSFSDPPGAMIMAAGSLWIATTNGLVLRVDPGSGRVEATIPGGGSSEETQQLAMTFGNGIIWVTRKVDGSIDRILTVSSNAIEPIKVGQIPTGVAVGYGSVWVTVDGTG
jgi:YVTN family beta-propeller protein